MLDAQLEGPVVTARYRHRTRHVLFQLWLGEVLESELTMMKFL